MPCFWRWAILAVNSCSRKADFRSAADARLNAVPSHQRTNYVGSNDAESCAPLELAQIQARLFP
jgi:hypothetical protein